VNGAKTTDDIVRTIKGGFMAVMRMTWISSPLAMVIAQKFIAPQLWVPFFNLVSFTLGTYFTTRVKMLRLQAEKAALKKKAEKDQKDN